MKGHGQSIAIGLAVALWAAAAGPPPAVAVQCPGSGAVVSVCITNPTATSISNVTISGGYISGEISCTSASASYSRTVTVTATDGDTECFDAPSSGGLNTGMYVHHISVGSQSQYQKVPVLYSTSTPTQVNWTYYPNVITVSTTGDAYGGSCGTYCTLRQAITTANNTTRSSASPVLIQFSVSPGTMTGSSTLSIGDGTSGGYITLDGTDSSGNPWIVGDALAAAQGNQDSFPRVVDLNATTSIVLQGSDITIKGLEIDSTGGSPPNDYLISGDTDDNVITSVRLDGGAASTCTGGSENLVNLGGSGNTIRNVEGRSACGNGLEFDSTTSETIRDSWLHNNIGCSDCEINGANLVGTTSTIERNTIELAGMRASDNTAMNNYAAGIMGNGVSSISTDRNLVRNNSGEGISITASSVSGGASLANDYTCGNGYNGVLVTPSGSSWQATGTGLTPAYNLDDGLHFDSSITTGTLTFDNNSGFPQDSTVNNQSSTTVTATNNQWWDPSSQITGSVTYTTVQNLDGAIALDTSEPTYPSNVMLKGQTIRVQGTGFNAITGNPYSDDVSCSIGLNDLSTSCCRMSDKGNVCGSGTHNPTSTGGNCVELKAANQSWTALSVTSVTPTTIVTEIPSTVFACIGDASGTDSLVHVSKRRSDNSVTEDERPYCTNVNQL